jgi:hypothetical protein
MGVFYILKVGLPQKSVKNPQLACYRFINNGNLRFGINVQRDTSSIGTGMWRKICEKLV